MFRKVLVALVLVFAFKANAVSVIVLANGFDTDGTSDVKENHNSLITTGGDSHTHVLVSQGWDTNSSAVMFFHFPYPTQQNDGGFVKVLANYETNENTSGKITCGQVNMVAQANSQGIGDPHLYWTDAKQIPLYLGPSAAGASLLRRFVSQITDQGTIYQDNTGTTCNHTVCDHTIVRGTFRRNDSFADCLSAVVGPGNLSTASFAIVSFEIILNQ